MSDITLWHNARCSKSREALALLRERGVEPELVHYLETAPTAAQLAHVLDRLGVEPRAIMRSDEPIWQAAGLDDPRLDRAALIDAMIRHSILIQRPIAIRGDRAVLGRPPQRVLDLL